MAHITKKYYLFLKDNELIERHDMTKLASMSAKLGIKDGKGLHRRTFSNIIEHGHSCSGEVLELIRNYYEPKIEVISQQSKAIIKMKRILQNIN